MADIWVPDVSEFQSVDFGVFSGPIIVRAHNSNRADNHWGRHAAGAAHQPWWGAYQYLTKGADPTAAAHAFIATIGGYSPNVVILDLEEGDGDQRGRQHAWLAAVTGHEAWTYSGVYFARSHNLDNVQWLAAYQSHEPTDGHLIWQAADNHDFPGIGACDGSLFHGSVNDLIAATGGHPTGPAAKEQDDMPMQMVTPQDYPDGTPHPYKGYVFIVNGLFASHVSDPDMLNLYKFLGVAGPVEISAKWFDNLTLVPNSADHASSWSFTAKIDVAAIANAVAAQLRTTGTSNSVAEADVQRIAVATIAELARRAAA